MAQSDSLEYALDSVRVESDRVSEQRGEYLDSAAMSFAQRVDSLWLAWCKEAHCASIDSAVWFAGTSSKQLAKSLDTVANYENPDEIDMIMSAARALRDEPLRFYLAGRGSALTYAQTIAEREGLTNVIFPGPVARENLADVMNQFDVGLCIYKRSPMDDARSPMRLLGYSALGYSTISYSG